MTAAGRINMATPILVAGAAGRVGGDKTHGDRTAVEAKQGVRAIVPNEDERAQALRDTGDPNPVGIPVVLDFSQRPWTSPSGLWTGQFGLGHGQER